MVDFKELNSKYKSISFYKEEHSCQDKEFKLGDEIMITNEISGRIYDSNYSYPRGITGRVVGVYNSDVLIELFNGDRISISKEVDSSAFIEVLSNDKINNRDRILIRKLQKIEENLDTVLKNMKNFQESYNKILEIKSNLDRDYTEEEKQVIQRIENKLTTIKIGLY